MLSRGVDDLIGSPARHGVSKTVWCCFKLMFAEGFEYVRRGLSVLSAEAQSHAVHLPGNTSCHIEDVQEPDSCCGLALKLTEGLFRAESTGEWCCGIPEGCHRLIVKDRPTQVGTRAAVEQGDHLARRRDQADTEVRCSAMLKIDVDIKIGNAEGAGNWNADSCGRTVGDCRSTGGERNPFLRWW